MKYIRLMRVKHYLKNILIFFPLIFSGNLFVKNNLIETILAFVVFSLLSSVVYIINDIKDIDKDKNHPIKKKRPIASGEVSIKGALILAFILFLLILLILSISKLIFSLSSLYLLMYLIINILYSYGLKEIPIVDVIILSFGFLIRVLYGGEVISVSVSNWLFLTVLSCSFYMALGKRRNELIKINKKNTRNVLNLYTKEFLDKNMYIFLTLTIVFYSLWSTMGIDNYLFKFSVIFIILILMKYSINVESDNYGDPIEVIFNDKLLIIFGLIYVIFCLLVLYV